MNRHPWVIAGGKGELELEAPMMEVVQTHIIPERDRIDEDVLRGMTSLGCFKDKEKLVEDLLKPTHNTGKSLPIIVVKIGIFYHLNHSMRYLSTYILLHLFQKK